MPSTMPSASSKTVTAVRPSPTKQYQPTQQPNVLMCRTVARLLLHARHFGWMRSAGTRTFSAVEECVADDKYVPMCTPVEEPLPGSHAPIQPSNLKGRFDDDDTAYESGDDDVETPVVSDAEEDEEDVVVVGDGSADDAPFTSTTVLIVSHAAMRRGIVSGNPSRTINKFNPVHIKYIWSCKKKVVSRKFISGCPRLESVELIGFENVVAVGGDFMSNCPQLQSFDFATSMPKLKQVGRSFLAGSKALREVDMAPLLLAQQAAAVDTTSTTTTITTTQLTKVENTADDEDADHVDVFLSGVLFLANCPLIKSINLQPFTKVSTIREGFLSFCTGLEEIDLTPFSSVQWIYEDFMRGCSGLKEVDLTPFSNVTHITGGFMAECTGIASIDVSPLVKLKNVGGYFMERCTCLKCVTFGTHPDMQCIDGEFLKMCTSLKSVEISKLVNLRRIYKDFLAGCSSLEYIDLSILRTPSIPPQKTPVSDLPDSKVLVLPKAGPSTTTTSTTPASRRLSADAPPFVPSGVISPIATQGSTPAPKKAVEQKQQLPPTTATTTTAPNPTRRMVAVSARGFLQGCTQLRDTDVSGIRFTEHRNRRRGK